MAEVAIEGDARHREMECPALGELLAAGVDDLTKFQILAFLCRRPAAAGDAAFFARSLGLWSPERTETALAEMVQAGILERQGSREAAEAVYALPAAGRSAYPLCTTCILGLAPAWQRETVAQLALRSLRRMRPRKSRVRARRQTTE